MKKYLLMAIFGILAVLPTDAQVYRNSRYYNPGSGRLDYSRNHRTTRAPRHGSYWYDEDSYFGFRVGPAFTTVSSDDPYLDGSSMKTGLNIGMAAGFAVAPRAPLFFETGLYYTEKGGKAKGNHVNFTYNLDYLEVPLVFKYKYAIDRDVTVEPFLGGYLACGVGGKIKDFGERAAYSSFSDNPYSFQRFDGGLRLGCGMSYDIFYADLTYDLGLANICHDDFDTSKNQALMLTVGLNF
ncbi:MAG: PorT family protein [Prevotella sp.]|nr:PorT family protein [Prevotella sp.]MBR1464472.1 PorT family protein [Prevotella sp.]